MKWQRSESTGPGSHRRIEAQAKLRACITEGSILVKKFSPASRPEQNRQAGEQGQSWDKIFPGVRQSASPRMGTDHRSTYESRRGGYPVQLVPEGTPAHGSCREAC